MKVSEYIDHLIAGECSKLTFAAVGDMTSNPGSPTAVQTVNRNKWIKFINLANLAIHKRYHLLRKEFIMDYPVDGEEYNLPANFLVPIRAFYNIDNDKVSIKNDDTELRDSVDTLVSILMDEPFKAVIKGVDQDVPVRTEITLKYAASPAKATTIFADLKVSDVYTEALLNYAAYKAHSSVSGDIKEENNTYYLRYEASCKQLVNQGLSPNNEIVENTKLEDRGFV